MNHSRRVRVSTHRNALLCALAVAVCVLLTHPFLEMPVNDDFSYTKSAFDFARTGHILYNGWATTMLGWQILWGGLAVKLFGYSFTAVRFSILPFAMGSVYLLYILLAGAGANAWNASLGALTLGLSPMFIPLAASFMSDVPALFCILLCLYMCQRAVQASSDRAAIAWLLLATVSNVLDGTVRQIVWLGTLVMVPSAAWLLRRRRRVVLATGVMWLASIVGIVAFTRWFQRQPYTYTVGFWERPASVTYMVASVAFQLKVMSFVLTLLLIALPLLIASVLALRAIPNKYRLIAPGTLIAMSVLFAFFATHGPSDHILAPWLGNVMTEFGVMQIPDVTAAPVQLSASIRLTLSLLVFISLGSLIAVICARPAPIGETSPAQKEDGEINLHASFVLTIPFALVYLGLMALRSITLALLDRYLLPLLPVLILLFVLYYQQRVQEKLPWASVAVLAAFALYATAATHDYFSTQRARLAAAQEAERAGVPRTQIHGPLEYDGWTQLQTRGHINVNKIQIPAGAYQPAPHRHLPPAECRFWFSDYLTSVHPRYVVVYQPSPCFQGTAFPPINYRLWLPPFASKVYVERLADGYDWIE